MREKRAKQLRKAAAGVECKAFGIRDEVGDHELFEELMAMGAKLDRRAADILGQRAYRVILEHEPVYAFTEEEAIEKCLGNEPTTERRVEEVDTDA